MKRNIGIVVIALTLTMVGMGSANANCEHYEFAELKAMDKAKLKLNYCLNNIEISKQRNRQNTAAKLSDLELHRPGGASRRELDRNERKGDVASEMSAQCAHEADRILSVLRQKKVDALALMKECPVD